MKMLCFLALIFPSLVFAKDLPDAILGEETIQVAAKVNGSTKRNILSGGVPGSRLKGKVWANGAGAYGEAPSGFYVSDSECKSGDKKQNISEIPCTLGLSWNFSAPGTYRAEVYVYIQSEGGPEDLWTGDNSNLK
ncbi:hypothetical protein [Bdellovibrio sp. HCB-162]|uniref:hypothetical protein n=1 Tax=Bdellovibrio sp. HCB-162 TaxID=3394234 RepID=UPI0039BC6528